MLVDGLGAGSRFFFWMLGIGDWQLGIGCWVLAVGH